MMSGVNKTLVNGEQKVVADPMNANSAKWTFLNGKK